GNRYNRTFYLNILRSMRIFKTYLIWLIIPTTMLILAIILAPLEPDNEDLSELPVDFAYIKSDKKLKRTVKNWIGDLNTSKTKDNMDIPGLPIEMFIKEDEWQALQNKSNIRSFKSSRYDFAIRLNNTSSYLGTYKLRGAGSLKQAYKEETPDRLCYNIRLFKTVRFNPDLKLKKFYLMNMIFDPHFFKMRFSYKLLHRVGLFPSYHQFVSLKVNGKPQGIYLLVERPEDAIVRTQNEVMGVYRRRNPKDGRQVFETKFQKPQETENWPIDRLHDILQTMRGEELVREIQKIMDLDAYLTWLAFNSLVMCSDTSDEIYYYIVLSKDFPEGRIEFAAWDYDDIMNPDLPDYAIKDPLLFGCENEFDRVIQSNPVLYTLYKNTLKNLLTDKMTKTHLKTILKEVELEGDCLSTGLPTEEERQLKLKRKEEIKAFESELITRHSDLLYKLEN
ncbi:MAG: CotH kinase family protein, partial [Desulfobacterales bacterium]|nr:CotH kinase family protein [Desulfobacterales bacterium]